MALARIEIMSAPPPAPVWQTSPPLRARESRRAPAPSRSRVNGRVSIQFCAPSHPTQVDPLLHSRCECSHLECPSCPTRTNMVATPGHIAAEERALRARGERLTPQRKLVLDIVRT